MATTLENRNTMWDTYDTKKILIWSIVAVVFAFVLVFISMRIFETTDLSTTPTKTVQ